MCAKKSRAGSWESLARQGWRDCGAFCAGKGPCFQLLQKPSLKVDQNHVSEVLEPSHGLAAPPARAAIAGVSWVRKGRWKCGCWSRSQASFHHSELLQEKMQMSVLCHWTKTTAKFLLGIGV